MTLSPLDLTAPTCTCSSRQREIIEQYGHPHMSHCPAYVKRKYDMAATYRKAGMTVWANHCPGCGRWAHVIAENNGVDDVVWCRTICERCGIKEVESTWHEGIGWVDALVTTGGASTTSAS